MTAYLVDVEHTTTTDADSADPTADLRAFLDASPSPFHAVASAVGRLTAAGFVELDERAAWPDEERGFVVRGGALVAWMRPSA